MLCVVSFGSASAQNPTQKIGHLDTQKLLTLMPEAKVADQKLKDHYKELEDELKTMQIEYQSKLEDYQKKAPLLSDAIKMAKEKEIRDLGNRIQEFEGTAQDSYMEMSQKVQQPLLDSIQKAISEVAKEGSFTYILDTSAGNVLYFEGGIDVLPLVKKKLNIP